ncbi:MAG: hypothetical protein WC357_01150 [Candidatus Omnitrophota bacterium]|jgi:hypothetical protein
MYPQFKVKTSIPKEGILYYFRDRALFERCVQKKCALISPENAYEATEMRSAVDLVSSFATEIWRLEKRLNNIKEAIPQGTQVDLDSLFDQVQRIKDIFQKEEVEIKDFLSGNYIDGMSVNVLHFEEDKNIPKGTMRIVETVRPTVMFKGQVISHGEVIVAKSQVNNGKE